MMEFVNERIFFAFSDPGDAKTYIGFGFDVTKKYTRFLFVQIGIMTIYEEFQLNEKVD